MQSICPNPGCGAAYNLGPQHIGRKLTCKNCGVGLMVAADGLHFADVAPASPLPQPGEPQPSPAPQSFAGGGSSFVDRVKGEVSTVLFGAGALLVVVFLFLPLIDSAAASRLAAKVESGDLRMRRADAELAARNVSKVTEEGKAHEEDRKRWEKDKASLQSDADDARVDVRKSHYWYLWGMMLGFLLLTVASIGYLSPSQTRSRRVVGAIVVCSILLLTFITFVVQSAATR